MVEIINPLKTKILSNKEINRVVRMILRHESQYFSDIPLMKLTVEILLCSNKEIRKLNKQFRHRNYATDVLSFKIMEDNILGDIAISIDKVKSQAKKYCHNYKQELLILLIHGILHLLGYVHSYKMSSKEKFYLNKCYERKIIKNNRFCDKNDKNR